MSDFIPVLFIGAVDTLLALPHLVALLCCRRVLSRPFPLQLCGVSYAGALVLSGAIVVAVSDGATATELAEFFVPSWIVILVWWSATFFPVRRAIGLSPTVVLAIPAVFVPSVLVSTFFTTFPTYKWHIGNFHDRVQIDLDVATMFLWPTWLVAAIGLAIYTWTPFAQRHEVQLQSQTMHEPDEGAGDATTCKHDGNP